jgi:predicted metal-dependent hydrolase
MMMTGATGVCHHHVMETVSETVALPGGAVTVRWRRSRRARQVSLRIDPAAAAVVIALPPRIRRSTGLALLQKHAAWAIDRLASLPPATRFCPGSRVPLNGSDHLIRHVPTTPAGAWLEGGEIHVGGAADDVANNVAAFLRHEAQRTLSALVAEKAARLNRQPRRVLVKDTSTRWGSCAADRSIAFNWRVVMAPPFVQDYVAAHETAHLRHMNHSTSFWADVAALTPQRNAAIAWLKTEGTRLLREGRS